MINKFGLKLSLSPTPVEVDSELKEEESELKEEEKWTVDSILAAYYPDDPRLQSDIKGLLVNSKMKDDSSVDDKLKQIIIDNVNEKRANVKKIRSGNVGAAIPSIDVDVWGTKYDEDKWVKIYEAGIEEQVEFTKVAWLTEIYFQNLAHNLNKPGDFISPEIFEYGLFTVLPDTSELPPDVEMTDEIIAKLKEDYERQEKLKIIKKQINEKRKKYGKVRKQFNTMFDQKQLEMAKTNVMKDGRSKKRSGTYLYIIMYLMPEFKSEMEVDACVDIADKVFETDKLLKENGVYHNDLRPDNVRVRIVDDNPVPIIIDFGEADEKPRDLAHLSEYADNQADAFKIFCDKDALKGVKSKWEISQLVAMKKSKEEAAKLTEDRALLEAHQVTPSPKNVGGATKLKKTKKHRKTKRKRNKRSLKRIHKK